MPRAISGIVFAKFPEKEMQTMKDQKNLSRKKTHLLKTIKDRSSPKQFLPKFSSLIGQLLIIKKDGKKLIKDVQNSFYLLGKLLFKNSNQKIKE